MEKKLSKAGPKVYHDNVKGAMPTLRMRDAEGKVVEEVNVAEWKADDILAFLKDKLDDEPLVKVSRADAPKDAKRGAKGTKDSKGGKVKVSRGKPYDPENKDVPPGLPILPVIKFKLLMLATPSEPWVDWLMPIVQILIAAGAFAYKRATILMRSSSIPH